MQVTDVMTTDLGYCIPEEATTKAARLMKQLDTGIVPIVASESNKQLLGVVTDRDLCMAVVAEGLDPTSVTLEQCMSTPIVTTDPDDNIDLAIHLMRDHQIRRVPVVNTAGKLEGMVSTADVFQRAEVPAKKTHEALSSVSEPSHT